MNERDEPDQNFADSVHVDAPLFIAKDPRLPPYMGDRPICRMSHGIFRAKLKRRQSAAFSPIVLFVLGAFEAFRLHQTFPLIIFWDDRLRRDLQ
ncbi:hypothetical protein GCM10007854_21430 [Algimonas porphyrae]|uniref:Uncharacterized protein n=1 Tax=Algimonas porphyrae TaxID=1128113 RepID=A0ABQ5V2V9_9PROT|nr:hypothetical protein GCM10007854_21430 [Algimonas porphyrae]